MAPMARAGDPRPHGVWVPDRASPTIPTSLPDGSRWRWPSVRRDGWLRLVAALAAALLGSACDDLQLGDLLQPAPAHVLELAGTSWTVIEVSGVRTREHDRPTITFAGPQTMRLSTRCGTVNGTYALDTDGSALSITLQGPPDPCPEDAAREINAVVSAVQRVSSWSVKSERIIELHGAEDLVLERQDGPLR